MIDIKAIKAAAEAATPQPWIDPGEGNMPFIAEVSGAGTASAGLPGYAAGDNGERK